ncbi:M20 metallopeptidase family protein [Cryomorpha ignava]|uniref:M20 metallopeptidase family protein n=1 Tax=Cryomorpha ignava TaxID=101383 RepID=UPI001EF9AD3A|nr:M20 family metallopeptidase [Cryomorpha ignava]
MIRPIDILSKAASAREALVKDRRHLHANPELSFHEVETAKYIAGRLREMGIPFQENVGGYGIVAHVGNDGGKLVALRGDMDALPITEENEIDYASKNQGVMHACGHDVHTTCLLGAAEILKSMEADLNGKVRLLFQPAEERLPGGASLMIADGALKNPNVELIFGQHVFPDMEVGQVGFRQGMYMASADEIYITVKGKGGHAALPHTCIDPVLVTAQLLTALQQMVSRRAQPDMPTVLSFGKVIANGATNVIPDKVMIEGTMRTLNEDWRQKLHGLITELVHGLCKSMGAEVDLEIRKGYPCLVNDPDLTAWSKQKAIDLLGEENVHDLPLRMTAEDFAYFAQEVPACFYRLGTSNTAKKIGAPLHTSRFNIDEDALEIGASLMATLAAKALEEY